MTRKLKAAQDLRQLAGGELAGSACAVAELGEPAGSEWIMSGRIYRRRRGYLVRDMHTNEGGIMPLPARR